MTEITIENINSRLASNTAIVFYEEEFPDVVELNLEEISNSKLLIQKTSATTLTIVNGQLELLQISKSSKIEYLRIKNVRIKKIEIANCVIRSTFSIENCEIDDFTAQRMNTNQHWLSFRNCSKLGAIDLQKLKISQGIKFDECPNIGRIRLYNVQFDFGGLNIVRSKVFGRTMVVANSIIKEVSIYKSELHDNFKIEGAIIKETISIIENTFHKSCSINLTRSDYQDKDIVNFAGKIFIDKTVFKDGFEVFGNDGVEYIINSIKITFNNQLEGNINFKNITINKILLTGIITKSEISLNNILTENLRIEDLDNYSNFRLSSIKGNGSAPFNIKNSNLGSAILNDIDFNQFVLRIIKSTYNKINYSNTTWPDEIKISEANYVIPTEEEHKRKQNAFRQLKQAAKQNDNKIDELEFQRKEWNSIRKQGIPKDKSWIYKLNDWIVIQSNRTNNYGTIWIYPLILLLISNFFFFLIQLTIISPQLTFSVNESVFDLKVLIQEIKKSSFAYWHFLNPTHNLKHIDPLFEEQGNLKILGNSGAMFWNYFMRIVTGYFIYQIIIGFRKYSRK